MDHNFNVDAAIKYGVHEAIFIQNLYFWILKNKCNERHFHEGRYWTYNSLSALEKLFPYFTRRQIRTIISNCVSKGAIIKGNFNKDENDKTNWYALSDETLAIYGGYDQKGTGYDQKGIACDQKGTETYDQKGTGYDQKGTTIPDNKPDIYINNNNISSEQNKKFKKPTVDEIRFYCLARRNLIDPEEFYDFYEARGWRYGKTPMVDWQAAVRLWEKNNKSKQLTNKPDMEWKMLD